ncbi:accessory Sec system glycosyltransferase Asp1 [Lactococcus sp. S64]|uniref:accessory Sec system glycosyltransferase Asp1 n=1 Tax=Lactococcus sp. S64 TaxID=2767459 RepID=UPI001903A4BF|nr:accessory Sec system glycosyltransferase Asp1 [Lactococcus sp. S64]MBK0084546.1 accessory Sec system glycosyltransferase Asp1 [Lactococcus sp. S64]
MLYFLTDWQSKQPLESDIMFNIHTIFEKNGLETKLINTQLSPFLNYLMNTFGNYDSDHYIQLMDIVSNRFALNSAPLTLNDLHFPSAWERTYTRGSVLLSKEGVIKAEVYFNAFGFVSQVHYPTSLGKEIQVYSEKGTLLTQSSFDASGEAIEQRIYDEGGELILTQWGGVVFIEKAYHKRFEKTIYQSFEEVCIELLHLALIKFNPKEDRLVVDGTNSWIMSLIEGIEFPESVVYIFSGSIELGFSQVEEHLRLIENGKAIITDNLRFQEVIMKGKRALQSELHVMPLYPTTLSLGESNNFLEGTVYWQIEAFDSQTSALFEKFLEMKLTTRELCLRIESEEEADEIKVEGYLSHFVAQKFEISLSSPEYGLVKQYYEALENEEMTPGLRDLFQATKQENPMFNRVIDAYVFYTGISFRKSASVDDLKGDFKRVRIFIDHRQKFDFLSHSLAVSAGIPILSKTPSPYLINGKNGLLYEGDKDLVEAVRAYLTDPDLWNQSLVESVEVIENNSAEGLIEKWKEVLK